MNLRCTNSYAQSGLTLIEVLVTLLVLSIGLIGIGLLHIQALQFAHSSYHTSIASVAALDFEERLWVALGNGTTGCLDAPAINTVRGAVEGAWGGRDANQVVIPDLEVELRSSTVTTTFIEAGIDFNWEDPRFDDDDSNFSFTARTVCFIPPPPPPP